MNLIMAESLILKMQAAIAESATASVPRLSAGQSA
jgi:hypothetical protein